MWRLRFSSSASRLDKGAPAHSVCIANTLTRIAMSFSTSTLRAMAANPHTIHSLANGTLLGSCIWGSFISGVVAYKTLPRQVSASQASRCSHYRFQ